MKLPNIKEADKFIIDCNGFTFVYVNDKELCTINKDGIHTTKFSDIDEKTLEHILEEEKEDLSFKNGGKTYSINDFLKK